jgi:predicted DNA-binding transcriptional regulator AlpA
MKGARRYLEARGQEGDAGANGAATSVLPPGVRTKRLKDAADAALDSLQYLRINDVCRLLRISKPTLWRIRRTKDFPKASAVTDRVIAWRRSEVEEWLRARSTGRTAVAVRPMAIGRIADLPKPISASAIYPIESAASSGRRRTQRPSKAPDEQLTLPFKLRN